MLAPEGPRSSSAVARRFRPGPGAPSSPDDGDVAREGDAPDDDATAATAEPALPATAAATIGATGGETRDAATLLSKTGQPKGVSLSFHRSCSAIKRVRKRSRPIYETLKRDELSESEDTSRDSRYT